ncbi:sterol desaturase family protein, partial [Parasphingorhabdus sp.]|uniref:sterol desaturase family protein n=1 Tax=Parasphingorhabdus sp. TaxID=2709688 RepID=UPI003001A945
MRPELLAITGIFLVFGLLEFFRTRLFRKPEQTRDDAMVEIIGSFVLLAITQPAIIFAAHFILGSAAPEWQGALAGIPLIAAIALFLVFDDMMQYFWHRLSHSVPFLYNLHRSHHNAKYMSVRLVYRNNIFYYLTMPSIWFSGALIYLGLG